MDFLPLVDWGYSFYAHYPLFCYAVGGILLILVLWQPFKVLKSIFIVLVLVAFAYLAFYLIDSMNVGMKVKDKAIHRTEKAIEK